MMELLAKQTVVQRSIERALENFKKLGKANLTAAKIRSRLASLQDNWSQFQAAHVQLLQAVPEKDRAAMAYFRDRHFDAPEDVYQSTRDFMTDCLEELKPVVSHNTSPAFNSTRLPSELPDVALSHMPPIRLPPFDGTYSEWENFRDRFSALVIRNQSLGDFARMHYLVSSLQGRALDCVTNIPIIADNFQVAWSGLTSRFENKRRLIASHFLILLGLSALQRESAVELQALCDKVRIAVASLASLGRSPSDLWSDFLVHLLSHNLDPVSRKAWNLKVSDAADPPLYDDLLRFLVSRCRGLEEYASSPTVKSSRSTGSSRIHVATASASVLSCPMCKARHYLTACPRFIAMNPRLRMETAKRLKRCLNCLSAVHLLPECKSQYSCRTCHKRHHSILHVNSDSVSDQAVIARSDPASCNAPVQVNSLVASTISRVRTQVLLATARVKIAASSGRAINIRALLDQDSEATFISEALAQALRAKRIRMPLTISAVGGAQIGHVRQASTITVSPVEQDSPSFTTTALILSTLTAYAPKRMSCLADLAHLSHLSWADADPTSSDPIHMIIGADLYSELLLDGVQKGSSGQPIAQNTVLGWIISGALAAPSAPPDPIYITVHHCSPLSELQEAISQFWEVEELPSSRFSTPHEEQCEAHFIATHSRTPGGQYVVRLPFITDPPVNLGQSRVIAEKQLQHLSRRLNTQPALRHDYFQFMEEYERLNHVRADPEPADIRQRVYIPHHPVFKADSTTTHLRVVFNASSGTSNGASLNDVLHSGSKLQSELPAILLQWRQFRFVYAAHIAKMYRQILIDERDLDYQRILWQPAHSASVCEYQLRTVTYGMKCSPFLALRVLQCLADDEGHRFPLAAPILRKQTYVDDVLFGDHDIHALKRKRDDLVSLLRGGHFELRKWSSNSSALLDDIDPCDHGLACDKSISTDDIVTILGIVWNPALDAFRFRVALEGSVPKSKRTILSVIARFYDPLGWTTPVTVAAKIFMQTLWRLQIEWDKPLPSHIMARWQPIYAHLEHLNNFQIPRWTGVHSEALIELHGFADASTLAYAAAVYIRVKSSDGRVNVVLLAGKSKVAPIKPLTVPRLELCAAVLLSRLVVFICTTLELSMLARAGRIL